MRTVTLLATVFIHV